MYNLFFQLKIDHKGVRDNKYLVYEIKKKKTFEVERREVHLIGDDG